MHGHRCYASCVSSFFMFVLTVGEGLCSAWCIYPILCWCPEIGTSSIDCVHLSRFNLRTETESSVRNVCFIEKTGRWIMPRNSNCINIPSSQTFRSYSYFSYIDNAIAKLERFKSPGSDQIQAGGEMLCSKIDKLIKYTVELGYNVIKGT
jgi:hypothetical protein